jgi:hypothetical protein
VTTLVTQAPAKAAEVSAILRIERRRQRQELRTLTCREVVERIIHPTPELASYRLHVLFAPNTPGFDRPIPRFADGRFEQMIALLRRRGCIWADPKIRLRQLNEYQRRHLVRALMQVAPRAWREAA